MVFQKSTGPPVLLKVMENSMKIEYLQFANSAHLTNLNKDIKLSFGLLGKD